MFLEKFPKIFTKSCLITYESDSYVTSSTVHNNRIFRKTLWKVVCEMPKTIRFAFVIRQCGYVLNEIYVKHIDGLLICVADTR